MAEMYDGRKLPITFSPLSPDWSRTTVSRSHDWSVTLLVVEAVKTQVLEFSSKLVFIVLLEEEDWRCQA